MGIINSAQFRLKTAGFVKPNLGFGGSAAMAPRPQNQNAEQSLTASVIAAIKRQAGHFRAKDPTPYIAAAANAAAEGVSMACSCQPEKTSCMTHVRASIQCTSPQQEVHTRSPPERCFSLPPDCSATWHGPNHPRRTRKVPPKMRNGRLHTALNTVSTAAAGVRPVPAPLRRPHHL